MSLLNLLQCFCFMFCYFALEECVILAPRQGIELVTPALEGEILTTGLQGSSQEKSFKFQFYVLLSQNILHYFFSSCENS